MKKINIPFLFCLLALCSCTTQLPIRQPIELNPNEVLNSRKFTLEGKSFLQTTSLFLPVGSIIDFRVGAMPYYWFSVNNNENSPTLYSRDLTSMIHFETGERSLIKNQSNKTMIKRISYGDYQKEEFSKFLSRLNDIDYVINIEIKGNDQSEDGAASSDKSDSVQNVMAIPTTNIKTVANNIEGNVPYMLFAYNKKDNTQFKIVTPSNLLDIQKSKNFENIEFFLAAYPSIYLLLPGDDLRIYFQKLNQKVSNTPLNSDSDCQGFIRNPDSLITKSKLQGVDGNCPYLKYWMVNYLISAKAVVYLNKSAVIKDFNLDAKIPDNSLSEINRLLWNVESGKKVTINYSKNNGILNTTAMQFFERKVDMLPLSWNCDEKNNSSVCIPSGPGFLTDDQKQDVESETPIYGVFNLRPQHMETMIEEAPKFNLNIDMVKEDIKRSTK
ncbi:hypothetical protein [Acinetobacter sp. YH12063]|uniref:hypothetical protein n=1 Tax=Acinetobacter sp. YH12063 TaxID=2601061 RepID=UPI0015D3715C|nr:hypothetical protein [Acinetobacter sp. YH12063]